MIECTHSFWECGCYGFEIRPVLDDEPAAPETPPRRPLTVGQPVVNIVNGDVTGVLIQTSGDIRRDISF